MTEIILWAAIAAMVITSAMQIAVIFRSPAVHAGEAEWLLIDKLRESEGASVTILCDNPDFNGQPNCAIEVYAEWTGWRCERFTGDTVFACLVAADERMLEVIEQHGKAPTVTDGVVSWPDDPDFREVDSGLDLRVISRLAQRCVELPYPTELTIEEGEVSDVLDYIERGRTPHRDDIPSREKLEERLRAGTTLMYGIPLKVLPASKFGECVGGKSTNGH